jgi:tRNA threonylcarbamoyladenosine biosynthesis protein TsaE
MMKNNELHLTSHNVEQTQSLGRYLGELAQEADIFLLSGNLGSGKTALAQGIAWGLNVKEYVFSPTFVLIREYRGRLPLYHIDLYRLECHEEVIDLALEDYFNANGVCVIEWAEKGLEVLPKENLLVTLEYISLTDRSIRLKPSGERYLQLKMSLEEKLKTWN